MELPLSIVKWTNLSGLQPARDAVEVKGMVAHSPCHGALFTSSRGLVCLAFNACIGVHIQTGCHGGTYDIVSTQVQDLPYSF